MLLFSGMWAPMYITICPALGMSLATIAIILFAFSPSCCVLAGACCTSELCSTGTVDNCYMSNFATSHGCDCVSYSTWSAWNRFELGCSFFSCGHRSSSRFVPF